jgi:hypothetical protein
MKYELCMECVKEIYKDNKNITNIHISEETLGIFYEDLEYGEDLEEINIYHFANKCKQKAYDLGFIIHSSLSTFTIYSNNEKIEYYGNGFENEVNAIMHAFKWILENK